ncbi:MAG: hypothetical protein M1821_003025 [Bathelium mastoideum]|nr:MAG: hypothetical protein M1821_003025 [Bathelium mastoideum]
MEVPECQNHLIKDSTFFKNSSATLPTPDEVRQKAATSGDRRFNSPDPPPVLFEEKGLLVKYGCEITTTEAQCLWFFNRYMKDQVPTPELFGWCYDGKQTFIYMELVRGDTLEQRWVELTDGEKRMICKQLHNCVKSWRKLRQKSAPYFVGNITGGGLRDIIFRDAGDLQAGPFKEIASFHTFFARYSCRLHPEWNPRRDFPELVGLTDNRPVVFTHSDLHPSNIVISKRDKTPPRVVAIIDWHQSGWYPSDWEWLKSQWTCDPDDRTWITDWLPLILEPADDEYFTAWDYIVHSM